METLIGRVGLVRTITDKDGRKVQNFSLVTERVMKDALIPRLDIKWHNCISHEGIAVNTGNKVRLTGCVEKEQYSDGVYVREIPVFRVTDIEMI